MTQRGMEGTVVAISQCDWSAYGAWSVSIWVTGVASVDTGVVAITRRHKPFAERDAVRRETG